MCNRWSVRQHIEN